MRAGKQIRKASEKLAFIASTVTPMSETMQKALADALNDYGRAVAFLEVEEEPAAEGTAL